MTPVPPVASTPLVSVILPTYNRLPYLREAVASVFAQTYPHWELIVVDDGSTDGTAGCLARLEDERVRVVRRPNRSNAAVARNAGLDRARGDYVAFLDSDDLWLPRKLELQIARLRSQPECRWSYTHFGIINRCGEEIPILAGGPWFPHEGWVLTRVITTEVIAPLPTIVADRKWVADLGGFDERLVYGEDLDLRLRMADRSPVCAVADSVCRVREHSGRTTYMVQEIHLWWARVYKAFRRRHASTAVRRLCQRECAYHLAYLGNHYSQLSSLFRAVPYYLSALRHRPGYPWLWFVILKSLARAVLPGWVRDAWRTWRTG